MSATFETAVDEMSKLFWEAWEPTGNPVHWPGVAFNVPGTDNSFIPPQDSPWARFAVLHATGGQRSLTGLGNKKKWGREGTLWVQIFVPIGSGLSTAYQLAKIVTDAYEGVSTPSCVWFRNARINEVGATGGYEQLNVRVDFTYDEIK